MSELTKEQYEELPDFAKEQYVEDGEGFSHKGMLKVKQTANDLDSKWKQAQTQLSEFEAQKLEAIEKAKAEAMEKARTKGDAAEIEKQYQEQIDDLKSRSESRINELTGKLDELTGQIKAGKRNELVSDLAAELATDTGGRAFKRLISDRIDVNAETGKVVFLDDEGRATSLSLEEFKAEIKQDASFAPLLKTTVVTTGGGLLNGPGNGGRATSKADIGGDKNSRAAYFASKFNLPN